MKYLVFFNDKYHMRPNTVRAKSIYFPGLGRVNRWGFTDAGVAYNSLKSPIARIYMNLTTQGNYEVYPFVDKGKPNKPGTSRLVSKIDIVFSNITIARLYGAAGLFELLEKIKLNPLLVIKTFSLVENNLIMLWNERQSDVYRIDLRRLKKLQVKEVHRKGNNRPHDEGREKLSLSRLLEITTLDSLILEKVVLVRKVSDEEVREKEQKRISGIAAAGLTYEELCAQYWRVAHQTQNDGQGTLPLFPEPK